MDLCNIRVVKELLGDAGTAPRKKFGQNFLINASIPERIAEECADTRERLILEIGPGIGCLTKELAARYESVTAVEIDRDLLPVLARTVGEYPNVEVYSGDVMELDLPAFLAARAHGREISVAANLPYYITTPILMKLLECGVPFSSITVMVQSEVASRLTARPGSSDYGAITVALAYYGVTRRLFDVTAGNFFPPPKVDSAVVRLDLYREKKYRPADEALFFATVRAAFEMRRKTLVNALAARFGDKIPKDRLASIVTEATGVPDVRGERLSVDAFVRVSDAIRDELN